MDYMTQSAEKISLEEALRAATDTRALEIGRGALSKVPEVFRKLFGNQEAAIVADSNTFAAAGRKVLDEFHSASVPCREAFIFSDPKLYAEHGYVAQLEAALKQHDAIPVAVGSGTINDLCKLAAHRVNRPYLSVATAASMDGYTAFGASITHEGSKQTFNCPAPKGVVADLDVISAAPALMNAWGYADLIAKFTAGADWILADALGVELIQPQAWQIAQSRLSELVSQPAGVREGNPEAIGLLVEGLMLGGYAMQAAKSSRAASGAEHQFSHLWDMQHHTLNGKTISHGFKVGIGTLAVTAFYEQLLKMPLEKLDIEHCCSNWPDEKARERQARELFSEPELITVALNETRAKAVQTPNLRKELKELTNIWPVLRDKLGPQLLPFGKLKRKLQEAGAPTEPEQIGISRERLRDSFLQAWFIRRRFTVLDLAMRAGVLETCVNKIFESNGTWPINGNTRHEHSTAPPQELNTAH